MILGPDTLAMIVAARDAAITAALPRSTRFVYAWVEMEFDGSLSGCVSPSPPEAHARVVGDIERHDLERVV